MIDYSKNLNRRDALKQFSSLGFGAAIAGAGIVTAGAGLATTTTKAAAASITDVLDQWFGAWSSDDPPSAVAALYSPEGTYSDVANSAFISALELDGFLRTYLSGLSGYQRSVEGWFTTDEFAAVQQVIYGENQGFYAVAEIGAAFQCYAVTIFQFDGNLLTQSVDYYDNSGILAQLGVWSTWPDAPIDEAPEDDCGILCKKSG